eukprot:scaffold50769_cov14-Tisochrysis_lutea.AAC.1
MKHMDFAGKAGSQKSCLLFSHHGLSCSDLTSLPNQVPTNACCQFQRLPGHFKIFHEACPRLLGSTAALTEVFDLLKTMGPYRGRKTLTTGPAQGHSKAA